MDVFITTYNEPLDLVMTTALAAKDIRWPHSTWILDDGDRPEMRELAESNGIGYVTRGADWTPDMPRHAKAGNLNNALMVTSGEYLLILDADQIPPEPDILDKTLATSTTTKWRSSRLRSTSSTSPPPTTPPRQPGSPVLRPPHPTGQGRLERGILLRVQRGPPPGSPHAAGPGGLRQSHREECPASPRRFAYSH